MWLENDLKRHLLESVQLMNELKEKKEALSQQLHQSLNNFDSYVNIHIFEAYFPELEKLTYQIEAESVKYKMKCIIICDHAVEDDGQQRHTEIKEQVIHPDFNESFKFKLDPTKPTCSLTLKFVRVQEHPKTVSRHSIETQASGISNSIGECLIQIDCIEKEIYLKEWRDIQDSKDKLKKIGNVRIELNYIYSEEIHLKNQLKDLEKKIEEVQRSDIEPLQSQVREIQSLFGNQDYLQGSKLLKTQANFNLKSTNLAEDDRDTFSAFALSRSENSVMQEFDFHETEKLRDWTLVLLVVLITFNSFVRPDFLGLTITIRAIPYLRKKWTEE